MGWRGFADGVHFISGMWWFRFLWKFVCPEGLWVFVGSRLPWDFADRRCVPGIKKGPAGRCRHAILNRLISVWRKMHDSSSKFYTFLLWGFVLFYAIAFIDFLRVLWYSVYRVYRILLWELPVPSISPLPCAWFLRRKDIPIRVFFFLLVWFIKKRRVDVPPSTLLNISNIRQLVIHTSAGGKISTQLSNPRSVTRSAFRVYQTRSVGAYCLLVLLLYSFFSGMSSH